MGQGAVASAEPYATRVGLDILAAGGNAVDAAVAVGIALAVTWPEAGNLGSGGFLMLRQKSGRYYALDYRERAPRRAHKDVYLDATGKVKVGDGGPQVGWRAAGVPGTVAGLAEAHKRWGSGKLSWAELLEPARKLALSGEWFADPQRRGIRSSRTLLSRSVDGRKIFVEQAGATKLIQTDLAETLARLQKHGWQEFYTGETAKRIAEDQRRHSGLIEAGDLAAYKPRLREPVVGGYRGNKIISMPPPSSGGLVLLQILGMLEGFDLGKLGNNPLRYHLMIEAMRRGGADRAEWFGDPDFVRVPMKRLMDPAYIAKRRASIDLRQASKSEAIKAGEFPESEQTTHFTVIDSEGNAVSNTYTLNLAFGSGVVAEGTGVLLNNEMDDFAAKVGVPNAFGLIQGARNAVGPGKRPLSSMTPTFVEHGASGKLWLALGSPGGPTIINTVLQGILNVVDRKMSIADAVAAPRIHHQWLPDSLRWEPGLSEELRNGLRSMGHSLEESARRMGDMQAIMVDTTGQVSAASDPRGTGKAMLL